MKAQVGREELNETNLSEAEGRTHTVQGLRNVTYALRDDEALCYVDQSYQTTATNPACSLPSENVHYDQLKPTEHRRPMNEADEQGTRMLLRLTPSAV